MSRFDQVNLYDFAVARSLFKESMRGESRDLNELEQRTIAPASDDPGGQALAELAPFGLCNGLQRAKLNESWRNDISR